MFRGDASHTGVWIWWGISFSGVLNSGESNLCVAEECWIIHEQLSHDQSPGECCPLVSRAKPTMNLYIDSWFFCHWLIWHSFIIFWSNNVLRSCLWKYINIYVYMLNTCSTSCSLCKPYDLHMSEMSWLVYLAVSKTKRYPVHDNNLIFDCLLLSLTLQWERLYFSLWVLW